MKMKITRRIWNLKIYCLFYFILFYFILFYFKFLKCQWNQKRNKHYLQWINENKLQFEVDVFAFPQLESSHFWFFFVFGVSLIYYCWYCCKSIYFSILIFLTIKKQMQNFEIFLYFNFWNIDYPFFIDFKKKNDNSFFFVLQNNLIFLFFEMKHK